MKHRISQTYGFNNKSLWLNIMSVSYGILKYFVSNKVSFSRHHSKATLLLSKKEEKILFGYNPGSEIQAINVQTVLGTVEPRSDWLRAKSSDKYCRHNDVDLTCKQA